MGPVVSPAEVASMLRQFAELRHDLTVAKGRLCAHEGALAILASTALSSVTDPFEVAMQRLQEAAELVISVIDD